jgi:hypothetical protein
MSGDGWIDGSMITSPPATAPGLVGVHPMSNNRSETWAGGFRQGRPPSAKRGEFSVWTGVLQALWGVCTGQEGAWKSCEELG